MERVAGRDQTTSGCPAARRIAVDGLMLAIAGTVPRLTRDSRPWRIHRMRIWQASSSSSSDAQSGPTGRRMR